jgi:hypothetical protein
MARVLIPRRFFGELCRFFEHAAVVVMMLLGLALGVRVVILPVGLVKTIKRIWHDCAVRMRHRRIVETWRLAYRTVPRREGTPLVSTGGGAAPEKSKSTIVAAPDVTRTVCLSSPYSSCHA